MEIMTDHNMSGGNDEAQAVLKDFAWFPVGADFSRQAVTFTHADRATLAAQPFLDHRWRRDGLPETALPLSAILSGIGANVAPPALNFIWHSSFCCSTLLARALDMPGRNLSLCEPLVLVHLGDGKRAGALAHNGNPQNTAQAIFRLLSRGEQANSKVLIKPSNFANTLIMDALGQTEGRHLFLYSDLPAFLIAIARGGVNLHKYARRLFGTVAADIGQQLPWTGAQIFEMSDMELAALAWHMQMAAFRQAAAAAGGRAIALHCDAFLADPQGALTRLDIFFGLGLGAAQIAATVSGSLFGQHAKKPGEAFDPTERAAVNAKVREFLGGDLDRVVEWSYRACPGTPRTLPAGPVLFGAG
jgi:hypothetical protein